MRRLFFFIVCFSFLSAITSCKDSDTPDWVEEEKEDDGTVDDNTGQDKDEYTYVAVEYRELKSGKFMDWSTSLSQQTILIDSMNWYHPGQEYEYTSWGGRKGLAVTKQAGADGFFRVADYKGRKYLLDPDNGVFILHGIQHVRPADKDEFKSAEYQKRFSSDTQWSAETGKLLKDNALNYISYGSKRIEMFPDRIKQNLLNPENSKVAYAENLYLLRTFMWDMTANLGYKFDDDKYNRLVLLFEPTFASYIDRLIKSKTEMFRNDRHFIGYYLDNELPFASYRNSIPRLGIDLKHFLSLPDKYKAAREYARKFVTDHGLDESNITAQNQEDFRSAVADYYFRLTSETVRKYDQNHLILGARLHDWSKYNEAVVKACARYCDVVSLNYYFRWQPEDQFMNNLASWCSNKPFFISEFYVKSADASYNGHSYENISGGGWLVKTQKDRGKFHQNFCLRLLQRKNCVGWTHFEYADGGQEGQFTNKGIVSISYMPYKGFLSYVHQLNNNIFSLIEYFDKEK